MEAMIGAMLKKKCSESGWAELGSSPYRHVLAKPVLVYMYIYMYITVVLYCAFRGNHSHL